MGHLSSLHIISTEGEKMLLTHSSLPHYSFGSVLLHSLRGHLGIDPTVETSPRVEQAECGRDRGGENQLQHNSDE